MIDHSVDPRPVPHSEDGVDHARAEAAVRELLLAVGEDPDRPGLRETPARVARAYAETFAGLRQESQRNDLIAYLRQATGAAQ